MASFTRNQPHIYLITNLINGSIYIGQTNGRDKYYFGGGVHLAKAIKKYGKKNFLRQVLLSGNLRREELNRWEIFYIKLFAATNKKIGYNQLKGGIGVAGLEHTPEAIEKIKKRAQQQDNKDLIRRIQKEQSKKKLGTHLSKKQKILSMATKFGVNRKIEIYKDKLLVNTCDFSPEAEFLTGVKRANIRNNLAGLSKSAGGFVFKYKEI